MSDKYLSRWIGVDFLGLPSWVSGLMEVFGTVVWSRFFLMSISNFIGIWVLEMPFGKLPSGNFSSVVNRVLRVLKVSLFWYVPVVQLRNEFLFFILWTCFWRIKSRCPCCQFVLRSANDSSGLRLIYHTLINAFKYLISHKPKTLTNTFRWCVNGILSPMFDFFSDQ